MNMISAAVKTEKTGHSFWQEVEQQDDDGLVWRHEWRFVPVYLHLNVIGTYDVYSASGFQYGRIALLDGDRYLVLIRNEQDTGWLMATDTFTLDYALVCLIAPEDA